MAPLAAFAAIKTGQFWLKAAPWIGCAVLLAALAIVWKMDAATIDGLTAERDAKADQLILAQGDANRWRVAAETANTANDLHNAEAERARADLAKTESILATMDAASSAEAADLQAQIAKWKERANAHPDQTCRLGPLDRDAVRVLVAP